MAKVLVDGKAGGVEVAPSLPFRSLFEALQKQAGGRKRLIVSMILDGRELSREQRAALADTVPGTGSVLEVRTADLREHVLQTLDDLRRYAAQMEGLHEEAAALMRASKSREALEKCRDCFQGWLLLVRGVAETAALTRADLRTLQAGGSSVDLRVRRVQEALQKFQEAFGAKDAPRVARLVQDELRPLLQEWGGVLDALWGHADAAKPAGPQID